MNSPLADTLFKRVRSVRMRRDLAFLIGLMLVIMLLAAVFQGDSYIMHILIMSLIYSGIVVGWDLMMGYAGIFTFGQIAIFVVGAYAAGMLAKILGIDPWLAVLLGGLGAAFVGLIIGIPCLRLRGVYVALVTFAFHLVLVPLIKLGGPIGTGGAMYLRGIPPITIGDYTFTVGDKIPWFFLLLGVCAVLYFLNYKIIHSKLGLSFTALRDSEPLAKGLGVNDYKTSLLVFTFASFITGIMGGFYIQYVGVISTRILAMDTFLLIMVMLIVGGIGRFPGAVIGAFAVTFLSFYLRPLEHYRLLIFGLMVLLAVVFVPGGLMGLIDAISPKIRPALARARDYINKKRGKVPEKEVLESKEEEPG
ncbi:MAG: branched-chain amino acid ABC transporter permease [Dehalococcoidia bacterium]|nr:branched-chain amino acid ABC transporter permease [Dehalococcoidia bacterium]